MSSTQHASVNVQWIRIPILLLATSCLLALCGYTAAAEGEISSEVDESKLHDEAALAKTVQNPLANLITLPFQANYNNGVGADNRTFFNLNIQPVIPYPGEKWNIISRTIIPYNSAPVGTTGSISGFGDINLSLFWSPAKPSSLTWGVGPAVTLPTASNPEALGSDKLSIGPTGVVFYGIKKWTLGIVASNVWSVAGDSTAPDVNFFFAQWFANYNFGKGWALSTAPIITCDWEAASGEQCTVPWGLQISKVTHFGARPVNLLVGYYENSEHPTGGADSQVRIQLNLMFPQKK
jgi:hypothetical protein